MNITKSPFVQMSVSHTHFVENIVLPKHPHETEHISMPLLMPMPELIVNHDDAVRNGNGGDVVG
jgi:hypothetical protein